VVQPIDVCNTSGPSGPTGCAPFNTRDPSPNPAQATSTTPIGFVDCSTSANPCSPNVNITRAIWLQAGIDITFLPIAEYNNTGYQALDVVPDNTGNLTSTLFKCLSTNSASGACPPLKATGCKSNCTVPLASSKVNAIPMFFVNSLQSGSYSGFAWLNGSGVAIASNVFFPVAGPPRWDTPAHEIGHNLNLDHTTFGALTTCGPLPGTPGCNVMDAGTSRIIPSSSGCSSTTSPFGELFDLNTGLCGANVPTVPLDQLTLPINTCSGNITTTSPQQCEALLSGFMNPVPNVSATAGGGGSIDLTVNFPKLKVAGGKAGQFIIALIVALPQRFSFGSPPVTVTGGSAQVFSIESLNGNNGHGNPNCAKQVGVGFPSENCEEIDYVVNPNPTPPPTCPSDPATCYIGSFTANTSSSLKLEIINKNTGLDATLADLTNECTGATAQKCLNLTYVFSDLHGVTTFFGPPGNGGLSAASSQLVDRTVPSGVLNQTDLPSVANLSGPPLTPAGFSQNPCTGTPCPPLRGGNAGNWVGE
jgi:hypothetical protein